jgi:large subunit ribosomal protein L21
MYAIIATGGKQYKVAEGDVVRVEKLGAEAGAAFTFDQVLAVSDENGALKVGQPTVAGASVEAAVVGDGKAKKVIVYKYKRKSGYHKKNGHRQQYTEVKIEKINA